MYCRAANTGYKESLGTQGIRKGEGVVGEVNSSLVNINLLIIINFSLFLAFVSSCSSGSVTICLASIT